MLPDFPRSKEMLQNYLYNYWQRQNRDYLGALKEARSYRHHEGQRWLMERTDGSVSESEYQEVSSIITIRNDEIPSLTFAKVLEKIDAFAQDMTRQQRQLFHQALTEVIAENGREPTGTVEFTQDAFLNALESMWVDFDEHGHHSLVVELSPELAEKAKSWQQDAEFLARFDSIIERKREEWRVRVSHRKLVD